MARARVAIAGIAIESSTFSPHISGPEAFTVLRGADLRRRYPFLAVGTERGDAADWVPILQATALPGGAVDAGTYRRMRDEIVESVRSEGPFDGLFLDIHGAMSVVGLEDAEADLARAIRAAAGPDTLISTSMDLHGNVSAEFSQAVDLITCYRMAPHEDAWNTRERAVHNLLERLRGPHGRDPVARRPWQAWVQVPVLLPGEKTSTRLEPARSLYGRLPQIEALDGIVDAAIWIGYAWADEPRCQAAIVVTGDDAELARTQAAELARAFWDARHDFAFVAPTGTLDECLDIALGRGPGAATPFVISDSGDNPTAGGAGDVSWTLGELLARPELRDPARTVIHASIFDPDAVAEAVRAGVGGRVEVHVGGRVDARPRGPVPLSGDVFSITYNDPVAGTVAVLRSGAVHAIITERRKPFHLVSDFTGLGLDPHAADVVVVKIGYLEPELYEMAADWRLALTPGGVDQDLLRLGHQHIERPMFPFDPDMPDPELRPALHRHNPTSP
ncbi:M81 family metallopeptidase [Phytoactinopolyspora halotolerans]|uniref:M81 family metallopeptidase n=1 Tax=Phytoactinopolyspora halotolerans TaxID=1981512 RepID=A0A6L9S5A1_9ACTN|nr:M81 family metallopeptidase [Phytoactinopolyspora halotolerans]